MLRPHAIITSVAVAALLVLTGCASSSDAEPAAPAPTKTAQEVTATPDVEAEVEDQLGSEANPYRVGETFKINDYWETTVHSVQVDGTAAAMAEVGDVYAPAEGTQYLLVNYTSTYLGGDPSGRAIERGGMIDHYLTTDGEELSIFTFGYAPAPEPFWDADAADSIEAGWTKTANQTFTVPTATAGDGVLVFKNPATGSGPYVALQ